jgi:MiaB/RimO family radical SAM methylthiotransferase
MNQHQHIANLKKRIAIVTNNLSCERHVQYYAKLEKYFRLNGWEICRHFEADKVLLVSCGYHNAMYEKTKKVIQQLKTNNFPQRDIIVMGCLPKTHEKVLGDEFDVSVVYYNKEQSLDRMIGAGIPFKDIPEINNLKLHPDCLEHLADNPLFYIKVADGCLRKCNFCVINRAKGFIRSVPAERILEQYREAVRQGKRRIHLMGEDALAYGIDNGSDIIQLMDTLLGVEDDVEISFGSVHCWWLQKYADGLLELCKRGIVKELHLGLQHVNDEILKIMGRTIVFDDLYKIIRRFKRGAPQLFLAADIIVGFPGETEDMFREMVNFFKEDSCFNLVRHSGYSDVSGAPSCNFKGKLQPEEIVARWEELNEVLQSRSALNQTSDYTRFTDITYKLTQMKDYFFCEHSYAGSEADGETVEKAVATDIPRDAMGDFTFGEDHGK